LPSGRQSPAAINHFGTGGGLYWPGNLRDPVALDKDAHPQGELFSFAIENIYILKKNTVSTIFITLENLKFGPD
jgi:hypothetical protein